MSPQAAGRIQRHDIGKDARLILARSGSFMQSALWARFKAETGWHAHMFSGGDAPGSDSAGQDSGPCLLVLTRHILALPLLRSLRFAYVPHGPAAPENSASAASMLSELALTVREHVGEFLVFLRFDLDWEKHAHQAWLSGQMPDRMRRGTAVQVPDTVILDLGQSEEELLAAMKPKWRYNIRLAGKKGVEISKEGPEALGTFYRLYLETAKRDGIAIHPESYYETLFKTATDFREASLSIWVARHEGSTLAAIITLFMDGHATYLYGASSGEKRNLMPAYALQWEAIRAAKAEGCRDYDFFGIPPDGNPDHPMAGLYQFKTGFGGRILHRAGSVDIVYRPLLYMLVQAAEAARLFWFKTAKKWLVRNIRSVRSEKSDAAQPPDQESLSGDSPNTRPSNR
jgi:lipid II:glycine glycyltransferase (peptidoglycan interpeptide bridge formation enzyme)